MKSFYQLLRWQASQQYRRSVLVRIYVCAVFYDTNIYRILTRGHFEFVSTILNSQITWIEIIAKRKYQYSKSTGIINKIYKTKQINFIIIIIIIVIFRGLKENLCSTLILAKICNLFVTATQSLSILNARVKVVSKEQEKVHNIIKNAKLSFVSVET